MNDIRNDGQADDDVRCQVCGKTVSKSVARTAEGRDYWYYFCGSGCEQQWAASRRLDEELHKRH